MDHLASIKEKIGGPWKVVEIDESLFYKRKNNAGRMLGSGWIFGGVERGDHSKAFMVQVRNRKRETLFPVILEYIEPGTTIISDKWSAYEGIESLGYSHLSVNHSENFVDPLNPITHTQNIENFWRWAKRKFLSTTKNKEKRLTRLGEHLFKKKYTSDVFHKIMEEIKLSYPIN